MQRIREMVLKNDEEVVRLRRHFHMNPEVGYEEHDTAHFVAQYLRNEGLEVVEGVGGLSVTGLLKGRHDGPCVALRADMDALPVEEETGLAFSSLRQGVMHACGHDGHMAMLLVAARVLSQMRDEVHGSVKFLFQSAEECAPNGGAKYMIQAGVLENPRPKMVFGLHLWPDVPLGKVGVKVGPLMSASDRLRIHVKGRGGHGAIPHQAVDAVLVASQIVTSLQAIVSRQVDPLDAAVVTIGELRAGTRYNVIAGEAHLDGTVRTQNEALRDTMPAKIRHLSEHVAEAMGAQASVTYEKGYPTLYNDVGAVSIVREAVIDTLGAAGVLEVERPSMGGEDFAFFTQEIPGAFIWLGCRENGVNGYPIHNSRYTFDETALPIGVEVLCRTALSAMKELK